MGGEHERDVETQRIGRDVCKLDGKMGKQRGKQKHERWRAYECEKQVSTEQKN